MLWLFAGDTSAAFCRFASMSCIYVCDTTVSHAYIWAAFIGGGATPNLTPSGQTTFFQNFFSKFFILYLSIPFYFDFRHSRVGVFYDFNIYLIRYTICIKKCKISGYAIASLGKWYYFCWRKKYLTFKNEKKWVLRKSFIGLRAFVRRGVRRSWLDVGCV